MRSSILMASFEEKMAALKTNAASKNSRSPLNDPFYAESLIIQSKSIVGRMYSSNEYVRFKYECELNQLVKEYRVWLAEIKREEREIAAKLDAMRQEQREISKERRELRAIQLVAKSNREFINHFKQRGINKKTDRSELQIPSSNAGFGNGYKSNLLQVPQKSESFIVSSKGNKLQKVLRLPKIVSKVDEVDRRSIVRKRRTSLPAISSENEITEEVTSRSIGSKAYEKFSRLSRQPEHIQLVESLLRENERVPCTPYNNSTKSRKVSNPGNKPHDVKFGKTSKSFENDEIEKSKQVLRKNVEEDESSNDLPLHDNIVRKPRFHSAPKSRRENRTVLIMATRPTSVSGTI